MIDNRWQMVTCKDCGKHYRCTPTHDYNNATTNTDGVCDTCLVLSAGLHPDKTITMRLCQPQQDFSGANSSRRQP